MRFEIPHFTSFKIIKSLHQVKNVMPNKMLPIPFDLLVERYCLHLSGIVLKLIILNVWEKTNLLWRLNSAGIAVSR